MKKLFTYILIAFSVHVNAKTYDAFEATVFFGLDFEGITGNAEGISIIIDDEVVVKREDSEMIRLSYLGPKSYYENEKGYKRTAMDVYGLGNVTLTVSKDIKGNDLIGIQVGNGANISTFYRCKERK